MKQTKNQEKYGDDPLGTHSVKTIASVDAVLRRIQDTYDKDRHQEPELVSHVKRDTDGSVKKTDLYRGGSLSKETIITYH